MECLVDARAYLYFYYNSFGEDCMHTGTLAHISDHLRYPPPLYESSLHHMHSSVSKLQNET